MNAVTFGSPPFVPFGAHPHDGHIRWLKRWQIASAAAIVRGSGPPDTFNTARFRVNSQWPLPPMSTVVLAGEGGREVKGTSRLPDWLNGELRLAVGTDAAVAFASELDLSPRHIVCAQRGAITGWKPKLFTGRADGCVERACASAHSHNCCR